MRKITEKDRQIIDHLMRMSVKQTAFELKTSDRSIYQALYRMRRREKEARQLVNEMNAFRKNPHLRKYLIPVVRHVEPLPEIE